MICSAIDRSDTAYSVTDKQTERNHVAYTLPAQCRAVIRLLKLEGTQSRSFI